MEIKVVGYRGTHDKDFIFTAKQAKEDGYPYYVFLLIRTPAVFSINDKVSFVESNSFVFLTPDSDYKYGATEDVFVNDWIFFDLNEKDIEFLNSINIPFNTLVSLANAEELSRIIYSLTYEHYSCEKYHNEIEHHYVYFLFYKLAQAIEAENHIDTGNLKKRDHLLLNLRTRINRFPETISKIDELAEFVGLSRSGFEHAYKRMFGTSVMNDVIQSRILKAQNILISTELPIKEVAAECGYNNEYNFMRQFKKNVGLTPSEYRKNSLGEE